MKIRSIKADVRQIFARVPLLEHPLRRRIVFCEVETDDGHRGHGLTGGGWPLHNMHSMAGLMNGWRVEFHLDMQSVGEQIFVDPPRPENNIVKIPGAPGLGLTPRADFLKDSVLKA